MADDAAGLENGVAAVVRVGAEPEARIPADAGEDGGAEERGLFALEGGGGNRVGVFLEAYALTEDGPAASRIALDVPGTGGVGFGGGVGLVALGEPGQEVGREDVARRRRGCRRRAGRRAGREAEGMTGRTGASAPG